MAKDDYETIEGGDSASDVVENPYTPDLESKAKDAQDKMSQRHLQDANTPEGRVGEEPKPEVYKIEGGDEEWEVPEEGADLEKSGEEVEEVEEVKEPVEGDEFEIELDETPSEGDTITIDGKDYVVEGVKGAGEEVATEADEKAAEDLIKYLEETGGTKYIVKGREYDLRDLSPQEIKQRFSLAGRAFQVMQEVAEQRKILEERERLAEDGARRTQDIMRRYGEVTGKKESEVPEIFKPQEYDSDEVKQLKQINAELYTKVNTLEKGYTETRAVSDQREYYRTLESLEKEFPVLSKEEVSAVMAYYPNADIRTVAENSHLNRTSDAYIDKVLEHRPDKLREIEEKAVEKFLAKKQQATKVSRKKASSTVSSKSHSAARKGAKTFDEIEARHEQYKKGYEEFLDQLED